MFPTAYCSREFPHVSHGEEGQEKAEGWGRWVEHGERADTGDLEQGF